MRLKSIFGQISSPISLYHFRLLQEFDLKKPSSPFKDLDKFLKPISAISFPLTVRKKTTDRKQRGKINKIFVHDIFLILKTTYFTGHVDGSMSFVVGDDRYNTSSKSPWTDRQKSSNNRIKLNSGKISG